MKTVGILTFHYVDNYGAVLQTYALRHVINNLPGYSADIINYIPPTFSYNKHWKTQMENNLFLRKRKYFTDFLYKKCGIKESLVSFLTGEEYDYFCVGSDQIWNTSFKGLIYFLPFQSDTSQKISYAASVGLSEESPFFNWEYFRKYIPDFSWISVREQEHVKLLESVTDVSCECVLDPVLLLDASDYENIIEKKKLREHEFIFFFWLPHDGSLFRGIEFTNMLSRKYNLPVVHSVINSESYMFYNDDGCMMFEGVGNFLWYIKNASYVVTNSYHATLFSIQYNKVFWSMVVHSMRSRFDSLVRTLGIGERIIKTYLPYDKIDKTIDYKKIYKKIDKERVKSMDYLYKALSIKKDKESILEEDNETVWR